MTKKIFAYPVVLVPVPEARIISDELFQKANKAIEDRKTVRLNRLHIAMNNPE